MTTETSAYVCAWLLLPLHNVSQMFRDIATKAYGLSTGTKIGDLE